MRMHRICCLVLVAVFVGGCGPGVRSSARKPVWPAAVEQNEQPVPPETPGVRVQKSSGFAEEEQRVRKSSGFAETEAGFVQLAPVEEEAPAPAPASQDVKTQAANPDPVAESAKTIADQSRKTATEPVSEKRAPETLPPPAVASAAVPVTERAKKTELVAKAGKEIEIQTPVVPPPATTTAVETQKSAAIFTPSPPVAPPPVTSPVELERSTVLPAPSAVPALPPPPVTAVVESDKKPATVAPPVPFTSSPVPTGSAAPEPEAVSPAPPVPFVAPPVAVVTDPDKGIATAIPISPVLPSPAVQSLADTEKSAAIPASPVPVPPSPSAITTAAPPIVPVVPAPPPATAVDAEKTAESGADKEIAAIDRNNLAGIGAPPRTLGPVDLEKAIGFAPASPAKSDQERLAELWAKRSQEQVGAEYPVGPGDVLTISVPGMDELKEQTVRISTDGTIAVPLIGTVHTTGKTSNEVREEIRRRLEADYMHNPQVQLFVKEYRSRQVAVVGAVAKPGLYALASGTETILEMVSQAGGVTEEAASYLQFVPAQPAENGKIKEIAATLPEAVTNAHPGLLLMEKTDPVLIDLQNQAAKNSQTYLLLPVWPGDVIMVPGGGEVLVDGWVAKPGSYKISRGLTVLGVIAAAGGSLFAADTSAVKVMRVKSKGDKTIFVANLEQIRAGKQQDIPVQGGDVIEVTASTVKLVPYGMYKFISTVFRVGASAPLF